MASTGLRQDSVHLKQRWPPERKSKCLFRRSYERIGDLEKSKLVEWLEETAEIQAIQFINGNKHPFSKISGYVWTGSDTANHVTHGEQAKERVTITGNGKIKNGNKTENWQSSPVYTVCPEIYTLLLEEASSLIILDISETYFGHFSRCLTSFNIPYNRIIVTEKILVIPHGEAKPKASRS